ncbi:uncharacterized protein LOC120321223 [Drosophila yakuba]|uniref:uncharacterized protein LOC120321223 n=1 Tax=Drosophila yakuba TaxID=7245 RepID=UPI0019307CD7|nr:uncharacterized protein LOC120321223 [Drosophila yakuba]
MKTKNQINIICSNCQCFSHSSQGIAITDEKNVLRIQSYTYKCLNHNPRPRDTPLIVIVHTGCRLRRPKAHLSRNAINSRSISCTGRP